MKFWGTCREASRLLVQGELGRLSLWQRLRLRMHLRICTACTRFGAQMKLMSRASERWRHYSGEE